MSNPKCAICQKTVYPVELVKALDQSYHKLCFKCSVCKITLNLKNYKGVKGVLYCNTHCPVERSTVKGDSVSMKHAKEAPKKGAEGLSTAHKGDKAIHKEGVVSADDPAAAPAAEAAPAEAAAPAPAEPAAEPPAEKMEHLEVAETPAEAPPAEAPAEAPAETPAEAPAEEQPPQ